MRWPLAWAITLLATFAAAADSGKTSAEFRQAYAAYRTAVEKRDRGEAVVQAQRALKLGRELYGKSHATTAVLRLNLGKALLANHEDRDAQRVLRATLEDYQRLYGANAAELIDPLVALGNASNPFGDPSKLSHYRRALDIAKAAFGDPSDVVIRLETDIGAWLLNTGHIEAGEYLRKAVAGADALYGREDARAFWPMFNLARFRVANHSYAKAEVLLENAIEAVDGRPETDNGRAELSARAHLVSVLEEEGKSEEATAHCVAIGAAVPWSGERNPTPIYAVKPRYPASALDRGVEGYVQIEFRIDPDGFVREPRVMDRKGPETFERNSLEAIEHWRYAPKVVDGKPVMSEPVRARVTFDLMENDELRRATLSRFD